MCGIIGGFHTGKDAPPVNEWALKTFEDQHERGMKGFGIVEWKQDSKPVVLRACEPAKFMFDIHAKQYPMMLVHHRTPTSTPNWMDQTHPIVVHDGSLAHDYLVVHNGVLRNEDELYKEHTEVLGFQYQTALIDEKKKISFNDSEALAIEVARFIEKQVSCIGARGSAAFIALQLDKESGKVEELFFGRNEGNPLKMGKTRGKLHLSSEGEGDLIQPFILYSCKLEGDMELSKRPMTFAAEPAYVAPTKPTYLAASSLASTYPDYTRTAADDDRVSSRWRDEEEWDKWEKDSLKDVPQSPFEIFMETTMAEVEDSVTAYLDNLGDPDAVLIDTSEETLREIARILIRAREEAMDLHNKTYLEEESLKEKTV